jgi:hypothetical protein
MPETKVIIDKISGKLATDFTPAAAREERVYRDLHDTLYYVNKDDPRGPVPADPNADPMYAVWEAAAEAIQWVQRNADVLVDSHGIGVTGELPFHVPSFPHPTRPSGARRGTSRRRRARPSRMARLSSKRMAAGRRWT